MTHKQRDAEHMERVRAVQALSQAERVARRRAYLEHCKAALSEDERRQLKARRDA
jgi:hypothetical protein